MISKPLTLGFLLVWGVFTLIYFRQELSRVFRVSAERHSDSGTDTSNENEIGIFIGKSQTAVASNKETSIPLMENHVRPPAKEDVPEQEEEVYPDEEDIEFFIPEKDDNDTLDRLDIIAMEEAGEAEDKAAAIAEEHLLDEVEQGLSQPSFSEAADRELGEKLRQLQDLEIFKTLCTDSRLRAQEVLAMTPPPPPQEAIEQEPIEEDQSLQDFLA